MQRLLHGGMFTTIHNLLPTSESRFNVIIGSGVRVHVATTGPSVP